MSGMLANTRSRLAEVTRELDNIKRAVNLPAESVSLTSSSAISAKSRDHLSDHQAPSANDASSPPNIINDFDDVDLGSDTLLSTELRSIFTT